MCFDSQKQDIFVFGGRIINASLYPSQNERQAIEFSGLYKYNVQTNSWQLLREDSGNAGPQDIRSRNGHSMLFDKVCNLIRKLNCHWYTCSINVIYYGIMHRIVMALDWSTVKLWFDTFRKIDYFMS